MGKSWKKRWRVLKAVAGHSFSKRVPLYYFDSKFNFGDQIGPFIVEQSSGCKSINVRNLPFNTEVAYCTAGSLLHSLEKENCIVWGAGFICPPSVRRPKKRPMEIRALRGPLSAEIANSEGWEVPDVYGDPGLLVPGYLPFTGQREANGITVIPHIDQVKNFDFRNIEGACFPWNSLHAVARKIANSRAVVSSSLHGIILAEAYRVPWVWWRISNDRRRGGEFKFRDFFESLGIENPPFVIDEFYKENEWRVIVERVAENGMGHVLDERINMLKGSMPKFVPREPFQFFWRE